MTESEEIENPRLRPAYFIVGVAGLIAISTSLVAFSTDDTKILWSNLSIGATSVMAVAAGALLLLKSGIAGRERRAYAFLVAALSLWLAAWLLWSYYELGLGIETPFPSAADALWLAGYGLSTYYIVWSYRQVSSNLMEHKLISAFLATIITSVIIAVFLYPIIDYTFSAGGDWPALLVGISYPVLDGILLTMAILTLVSIRPGQQRYHFIPSVMIMTAILAAVIADTGFGYGAATDVQALEDQMRIWDALYNMAYLCIAGALYWNYRVHALQLKKA